MKLSENEKRDIVKGLSMFSNIGFCLSGSIILSVFIGKWLDNRFSTDHFFLITCVFLGVFISLFSVYKLITKNIKK